MSKNKKKLHKQQLLEQIDQEVSLTEEVLLEATDVLLDFADDADAVDELRFRPKLQALMNVPIGDSYAHLYHTQGFIKGLTAAREIIEKS